MSEKQNSGCLKTILIMFALLLLAVVVWTAVNFGGGRISPGRPVVLVSPETTSITAPLDEFGDVDYVEAINQTASKGIHAENNSVVLIYRAMGGLPSEPGRVPVDRQVELKFEARLGIEPLPDAAHRFRTYTDWLSDTNDPSEPGEMGQSDRLEPSLVMQYAFARDNLWSPDQLKQLDRWLTDMENPLALVMEASQRSRYYHPLVLPTGKHMLLECNFNLVPSVRELAVALSIRANRSLNSGDFDAWKDDVLAVYRLSHHLCDGTTLIELLTSIAVASIADANVVRAATSGKLNRDQLFTVRRLLEQQPRINGFASNLKLGERFLGLDTLIKTARFGTVEGWPVGNIASKFHSAVDWTEAARIVNAKYGHLIVIAEMADPVERRAACIAFEDGMKKNTAELDTLGFVKAMLLGRRAKGKWMGEMMNNFLLPAMTAINSATDRYQTNRDMVLLSLALEAYRLDHGRYPEQLDLLAPDFIDAIATDSFTLTPFSYEASDSEYRLYSFGANGIDDGGADRVKDWPLEIRQPQPWQEFIDQNPPAGR